MQGSLVIKIFDHERSSPENECLYDGSFDEKALEEIFQAIEKEGQPTTWHIDRNGDREIHVNLKPMPRISPLISAIKTAAYNKIAEILRATT